MCSANEIALVYAFNRTYLAASTAVDTFFIIYRSKVILDNNSTGGAGLFAFSAGNTAIFAVLTHLRALIMIVTGYSNARGIADKVDYAVGAFFYTHSATYAFSWVDSCNALVVYANCVTRAYFNAIAIAEAGKGTEVIAVIIHVCRAAGFRTVVVVFLFFRKAKTVAGNVCNLLYDVLRVNAHNFRYRFGSSVTARDTQICLRGLAF